MKNILYFLFCLLSFITLKGQSTYYEPISSVIFANAKKGTLDVGINHEFKNTQLQSVYALTDKYFVFGTFNVNYSNYKLEESFLSSARIVNTNNYGYSLGGGIQNLGKIGNFKNLEFLFGFEMQNVNKRDSSIKYTYEDLLLQNYYKIFTQLNIIKSRTNFDFGYSLKLSHLSYTKFTQNDILIPIKSVFLIDPTLSLNFKMLPKKNLFLTTQFGFSIATDEELSDEDSIWPLSSILKLGVQYRFLPKK